MKKILVTGGNGQLALCLKDAIRPAEGVEAVYPDIEDLDITDELAVRAYFGEHGFTHCINCAAYTAVDLAESQPELAEAINETGAGILANACHESGAVLIQISTDFVFDGKQPIPYREQDKTNPLSVYGRTKRNGEIAVEAALVEHYIIRTSWLYSEYGKNFVRTMLNLAETRDSLNVVTDQIGTPTYAGDLASFILYLVQLDTPAYGIYHYSNEGVASWYDFAQAVFNLSGSEIVCLPIRTEAYPTPAKRPSFSVMDKSKARSLYDRPLPYWRDSLKTCLAQLGFTV